MIPVLIPVTISEIKVPSGGARKITLSSDDKYLMPESLSFCSLDQDLFESIHVGMELQILIQEPLRCIIEPLRSVDEVESEVIDEVIEAIDEVEPE